MESIAAESTTIENILETIELKLKKTKMIMFNFFNFSIQSCQYNKNVIAVFRLVQNMNKILSTFLRSNYL